MESAKLDEASAAEVGPLGRISWVELRVRHPGRVVERVVVRGRVDPRVSSLGEADDRVAHWRRAARPAEAGREGRNW